MKHSSNKFIKKPQETFEFELSEPRKTFSSKPLCDPDVDSKLMIGLTALEVYNSFFKIARENKKSELYMYLFDEFSFTVSEDELKEILSFPEITPTRLQHEKMGPRNIKAFKELVSEKSCADGFIIITDYGRSSFRDFESYLGMMVDLDEKVIQRIYKQCKSYYITYEIPPGIYTIEDLSEALYTLSDDEKTLQIEF